jgi:predicted amidohydrolase YtcJ
MLGMEGFDDYRHGLISHSDDVNDLRIGGMKIILHETTGQLAPAQEELNEMVSLIHESGFQAVLHAVEESTIEAACSAVEQALGKSPRSDHRHRIEHCSVCPPGLAKRIARLGITVVTQPSFIHYNGERYLKTVPEKQLQYLYPISTLLKNGVRVAGSSDCPVVPVAPLIAVYSAVSRKAEHGESVLPDERISTLDALRLYTEYAAEATFEEKVKGSITPGKLADLVVLSGDPTALPADEIKSLKVEMTILGGKIVWDKLRKP